MIPVLGRSPGEGKWQPTPVLLPGESHGGRSLVGYSPWGRKESDTIEQLHFTYDSNFHQSPGYFSILMCCLDKLIYYCLTHATDIVAFIKIALGFVAQLWNFLLSDFKSCVSFFFVKSFLLFSFNQFFHVFITS